MRARTPLPTLAAWIRTAARAGAKPSWRQWPEILWLFCRHGFTVGEYFNYGFHERGKSIRLAREYFGENWCGRKFLQLIPPKDRQALRNKVLFHLIYQAHGLPLPRLLCWTLPEENAIFDAAVGLRFMPLAAWIEETRPSSLVIKPIDGMQGKGIYVFSMLSYAHGHAEGWTGGRERLSLQDVLARLEKTGSPGGVIIQECVRQHADLARLNEGKSVNTARIVTHRRPDGEVRILGASLRYATEENVDNWHAGGVAARIDLPTGRIGPGLLKIPGPRTAIAHTVPADWTFPYWRDTLALAQKAALVRPGIVFVGWDITCAETGPVLIEGNDDPGVHIIQDHGVGILDETMRRDLRRYGVKLGRWHR